MESNEEAEARHEKGIVTLSAVRKANAYLIAREAIEKATSMPINQGSVQLKPQIINPEKLSLDIFKYNYSDYKCTHFSPKLTAIVATISPKENKLEETIFKITTIINGKIKSINISELEINNAYAHSVETITTKPK